MITDHGILFIEPTAPPSDEPVIDDYTRAMAGALNASTPGAWSHDRDSFHVGGGWRGFHLCSCGVHSTAQDYLLSDGLVTNSLAVHYLAFHRAEVAAEQLVRVMEPRPFCEPVEPTPLQLQPPLRQV